MHIVFDKINRLKFLVKNPQEAVDVVDKMISELSLGETGEYEDNITGYLFDTMLSRLLVSCFLNKHPDAVAELNFVSIDVKLPTRTLTLTAGTNAISGDKIKKFNGVLYA